MLNNDNLRKLSSDNFYDINIRNNSNINNNKGFDNKLTELKAKVINTIKRSSELFNKENIKRIKSDLYENNNLIKTKFENKVFNKDIYKKKFMNNNFKAIINIDNNSNISTKVIDLSTNEEYISINIDTLQGEFINKVRNLYKDILIDIKDNCFIKDYFITSQANRITNYIIDKYKDTPEFLWEKYPGFGIFRNK